MYAKFLLTGAGLINSFFKLLMSDIAYANSLGGILLWSFMSDIRWAFYDGKGFPLAMWSIFASKIALLYLWTLGAGKNDFLKWSIFYGAVIVLVRECFL